MRNPLLLTSVVAILFMGPAHAQEEPAPGGDAGGPPGIAAPMPGPEGADTAPSTTQMMPPGSDGGKEMNRPAEHDARVRPQARESSESNRKNEDHADEGRRRKSDWGEATDRREKADADRPSQRDARPGTADNTKRDKAEDARADESATGRSEGTEDSAASSSKAADLTGEQRTKVQSSFRSHKSEAEVRDLDISINVGTVVPSSVTLYSVPEEVVVLLPAYREYRYFIYENTVVIVDPDTLTIVDVLVLA